MPGAEQNEHQDRLPPWNEPFATPVQPYTSEPKKSRPKIFAGILDLARYFLEFSFLAIIFLLLLIEQYMIGGVLILAGAIFVVLRVRAT